MNKLMIAATLVTSTLSLTAEAVPWCYRGTVVEIADVNWTQGHINANFFGSVPSGVADPEVYITHTATHNYANTFAGGGGGFGGYSVPGSGQVKVVPYAPYTYTNMVGPGYYYTTQGVSFKLKKCYTIPPLVQDLSYERIELPDGPAVEFKPFDKIKDVLLYWTSVVDPDEDADFDEEESKPVQK